MAEIVIAVASKVAEYLVAPVGRQCGYVIFTNSYVGQLEKELEKLDDVRVEVQRSVDHADNNMWEIKREVNRWKNNAETVANKARNVLDNDGRAKKSCFCAWLPNPKGRYCLGRNARKTAEAIKELIPQGKFERVYYESAPPGLVGGAAEVNSSACYGGDTIQELIPLGQFENSLPGLVGGAPDMNLSASGGGDTITDSRASIFQDIMKALDDEKLQVIGVYGPGGVGKTTLLEEIEKKLREKGRPFHMIVKAKVLQISVLKKIQDEIADALKLDLKGMQTESYRGNRLLKRLQKNPSEKVLIILDDLWEELDLKAVGIPSGDTSGKCKLLLASRFKDVLEQKMRADRTFLLEGLNNDEAFRLFEKTVGDRLKDEEELRPIAAQVVKKLAGLPLLIKSVATTLKSSDECAWRNALIEIDDSNKQEKETIVRLSYDHLKSKDAKYLFLLCGLIGGTIRVERLFILAMGLGLFERFNKTMQDSRDRLNNMLNELRSACLLLDAGDDKDKVTIHDLYSEVVISTPFRDQNSLMMSSNYGSSSKEKLEKCWAICLDDVGRDRLAELMMCQFPSLKILMLSMPKVSDWIEEHQHDMGDCSRLLNFTGMKELQVLYLRFMHITNLPLSIEILGNLQSLYIYKCNVKDVAIICKLKALQILSFARSTIDRLPKEMGELTNLRLLNLSDCKELKRIEPGVLKCLIKLEELHMKGSFDQWMGKNEKPSELCNVGLAELRSMTKLNSLEISICDPIIPLEVDDLPFENLTRFWIDIGNVYGREFKGLRTMKIKLEGHDSILSKNWVQKTLQKTQYLLLDGFGKFENPHELCIRGFPQLKHLNIKDSPSVKYIASSSNSAFTILESLFLNDLINLEKICHGHIAAECFSKLKDVRVQECNRLEYLWSLSQMQNLVQLEKIKVHSCNSMRAIARKDIVPADCKVELPYLRHLNLVNLPNMTSFCPRAKMTSEGTPIQAWVVDEGGRDEGTDLVTTTSNLQNTYSHSFFDKKASLPNLETLKLHSVGSFKKIWHDELSKSSFCKLAMITITKCSHLLHIFPSTIMGRLHNLKRVEVYNCPSLKSLFDCRYLDSNMEQTTVLLPELERINVERCPFLESLINCESLDSNAEHKIILLPKLEEVSVSRAKKLRQVVMSHSQIVLGFPSLKTVSVENCSDLRYLFPKYTATTLMKLEQLTISKCEQMKEVILEKEIGRSEAKVMSFPCLHELTLKELGNLISFGSGSVKRQLGATAKENDESPRSLFNEMVTFPNMIYLEIEGIPCKELWNYHVPADPIICSQQFLAKYVEVKNCPSLKSLFGFRSIDSNTEQNAVWLPELVSIDVESCPSLESLFNCESVDSNVEHKITSLPKLEEVRVSGAKKLRQVVRSHSQIVLGFPSLKTVSVENCFDLRYLFRKYTATTLMKLEQLTISKCEQMKEVILEKETGRLEAKVMSFPCLSRLTLKELGNLISFGLGSVKRQLGSIAEDNDESPRPLFNEMVTFPNMRYLEIEGVPCKELWNNHVLANSIVCSHRFLSEYVEVKNCPSLKSLFDFGSIDSNTEQNVVLLPKLVRIDVKSCPSLESLFNCESLDSTAEHKIISLPKLEEVRVNGAKKLRHVVMSHSQIVLGFPSLKTVSVENCSDLRYLFPKYTATTLMKLEQLTISKCEQMKEVILEKETSLSKAKVMSFPCLSRLTLKELDNLISFGSGSVKRQLGKTTEENAESPRPLFNEMVTFPNMIYLEIEGVPFKELWNYHVPADPIICSQRFLSEYVKVKNCPSLKLLFGFRSIDSKTKQNAVWLPELVKIDVESCPSLESLFNCESLDSNAEHKIISLPKLEEVRVSGAKKLRQVVMSHSQIVLGFPSLKTVSVENCSDLRYLFPKYTATTLMKLEQLTISKCEQMKEVILEKETGRLEAKVMSFPCLSRLTLKELGNLISFGSGSVKRQLGSTAEDNDESPRPLFNEMVTFPNMRYLEIEGVPCKELWNYHVPTDSIFCSQRFHSEHVEVKNCPSLKSLFDFGSLDPNTEQNVVLLPKLVRIDGESCPSLESLFNCESLHSNVEHKIISLPKLEKVRVSGAKKLRHVVMSQSQIVLGLPSLKTVRVENCPDLTYLFPKITATTLMKLEQLKISKCEQMKEVILEKEIGRSEAKVMSFPCLHELTLKELGNLISFGSGSVKRQLGATTKENDESPQPLFNEMVTFPNMGFLKIEGIPCKVLWNNHVPADSIVCSHRLLSKNVKVKNCPSLKSLFGFRSIDSNTEQNAVGLPELVRIDVESCPSLESLFNCESLDSNAEHKIILLPKLEEVRVSGAKKLRQVVMSHSQIVLGFPSLKTISVENCSDLRYLFCKYTATTLTKLEQLTISKCEQMKEVILEKETGRSEAKVMSFPCLSKLILRELDNLISFGSGSVKRQLGETAKENDESPRPLFNEMVTFPNMGYLEIEGIPCKELWNNHVPADSIVCSNRFLSEFVEVKNCPSLKSLFDFGSLDSNTEQNAVLLPKLVGINVESCPSLESLFNCESFDSNVEHKIISLPKLENVRVRGAKKLRHVVMSHSQIVLGFPSLKTVRVENCSDLTYLFPKYTATTLMKLEQLKISKCEQMKEVILKKEIGRSEAKVMSFHCLHELTLKELDNLISFGLGSVKRQLGETDEENDESPRPLFNEMVTFPSMGFLKIEGIPCKVLWNNHVSADSIVCSHRFLSRDVKVKNCPSLKSLFGFRSLDSNMEQNVVWLPELERIDVESCPSLASLFDFESLDSKSNLEKVRVSGAKKLRYMVMSHSQIVFCFPSLEIVRVENCSDLRYLFPKYTATTLMKLEQLKISKCEQMKEVILEKEIGRSEAKVMSFPCLSKLTLKELDNLISFGSGSVKRQLGETAEENDELPRALFNEMVTFPNMRYLEIEGVPCKELWNNHVPVDSIVCSNRFLSENVEVKNCPYLKSLFGFSSLDSNTEQNAIFLPELVKIDVESCPSLESLFNCESLDSNVEQKIIWLPKLEKVRVSGAKKLRQVVMSHSQIVLGFPSLKTVSVENCSDLKYLFLQYTATTLMKLEQLTLSKCEQMKEVILEKEIGRLEAKVMSFPCLSRLTLKELDNLISFGLGSVKRQLGETVEENDESAQPLFNEMVTFPNMRYLEIEGVPCKELWNNHVLANSIVCSHRFLLEHVEVKNCPYLKSLFDFGSLDSNTEQNAVLLPKLVRIEVKSCPSLESLFNCESLDSNAEHKIISLPRLEEVRVSGAKKLRHMVMSHSQVVLCFPSLEIVGVENCSDLRYLFPKYTATTLMKLEQLKISKCEKMKEVILEKEIGRSEAKVMSFPCLWRLTLKELDNLISFGLGSVKRQLGETAEENDESPRPLFNEMVTFPDIRCLEIKGLRCEELWNNRIPTDSFQKVRYLKLKNCDNLQCIATSYMWKKLQRCLEALKVISCQSIETIYVGDGTNTESGELSILVLHDLENLRCIWQSDSLPNIPFPNLGDIEVVRCPRLKILFPTFTAKFLGQIEELAVESCEDMEQITGHEKWEEVTGTTITFSNLTYLKLFELPKFKSFLPEKYSLKFLCSEDFPSLEVLSIVSCGAEPDQSYDAELDQVLVDSEDYQID